MVFKDQIAAGIFSEGYFYVLLYYGIVLEITS